MKPKKQKPLKPATGPNQVNRTGSGPMKDSRTKRDRSRGDQKRNAIRDSR